MSTPIIICGQQRSGTTALQSALSRVDGVRNFGEIFQFHQPLIEEAAHNFYYYVNHVRGGWVAITSTEQAEVELSKYLKYLDSLTEGHSYIADIKYNLWHHFSPGWLNAFGRPFILEYFMRLKVPIIHVVRKNLFRQYVSLEFAARTRRWHYGNEGAEAPEIPPFDINAQDLAEYFEMVESNERLFRKRLEKYPHTVELKYEDLFEGRQIQERAQRELRRILPGWILQQAESEFVKPGIDPVAWVRNAEAVIDAFRESRFGVMVIDALRPPLPPPPPASPPPAPSVTELSDGVVADSCQEQAGDPINEEAQHEDGDSPPEETGLDGAVGDVSLGDEQK